MATLNRMQNIFIVCFALLVFALTLYSSEEKGEMKFINPSMSFYLNETQIMENTQAALKGDAIAALKNYRYYNFLVQGSQLSAKWLLVATLLENPVAMRNWSYLHDQNLLTQKKFIFSPEDLKNQEELVEVSNNTIECYWLYLHYVATGNQEKSAVYKELLQKQKVSEKLLGEVVTKKLQELNT